MEALNSFIQKYMGLGFTVPLLLVGMVMYISWTAAYYFIVTSCRQQKSYGVPFVCLCFNVIWECIFTFQLAGQNLAPFFRIGNGIWFLVDVVILSEFLKFGRDVQIYPLVKKHFYLVVAGTLTLCGTGLYTFTFFYGDSTGAASSMTMNLVMSILYIFMLFGRYDDLRGLSYEAAWCKMIGTGAGSVFLYFWLPRQYVNGILYDWNNTPHQPTIHQPSTFSHMHFLFISIFLIDCTYIYLLGQRRTELAAQKA